MPKANSISKQKIKPLGCLLASAGLVLVMILAGGYFGYRHLVVDARQQELNQLAREVANQQAAVVSEALRNLRARLRSFTRQEALARALDQNQDSMLESVKGKLSRELPQVRSVRFFGEGAARLDREGDTPIRFAELDMINRAEKRRSVLPEASQVNGQWRLTLVEPVPFAAPDENERPVSGVLFVSAILGDWLTNFGEQAGRLELLQRFPRQAATAITAQGEPVQGEAAEAEVANSYLLVRFTPSAAVAGTGGMSPAVFLAIFTAVILFAIALLVLAAKRVGTRPTVGTARTAESLFDVKVAQEDNELPGVKTRPAKPTAADEDPLDIRDAALAPENAEGDDLSLPAEIFRSYDIRGLVESQLTPANVVLIGQAIGSQALTQGERALVVARDGRSHSAEIAEQLIEGIVATGCNVVNIGMVPTPVMYFACEELKKANSGVMVTASHNPPEYNGFKIVIGGNTLKDDEIGQLRSRILQGDFRQGVGREEQTDVAAEYVDRILSDVALAGEFSVVIDAGNGVAGEIAPRLFGELGCSVTPLFCEVDGRFPNHPPDPSVPENLQALSAKVKEVSADLGIALDGDGDRVGIVTASGALVPADRLLMLLAKDIVSRNPGADILFDVKCSRELNKVISSYGGRPIMWKAGHSHMKAKMKETGAQLGGELSGHVFIKERWYGFDDGLYAAARILEIMSLREEDLDSILENFPALPATPEIKVAVAEKEKFSLVDRLLREGDFGNGRVTTIDGLRVDYPDGWGLVRASNTSAALTLRFEGEDQAALERVMNVFREQLRKVSPGLELNFRQG